MLPSAGLFHRRLFPSLLGAALLAAGGAQAQPPGRAAGLGLEAGAIFGPDAGLDGGGDLAMDAWSVRLSGRRGLTRDLRLGLAGGVGEQRYRFSGEGDFSSLRPWEDVREARLSGSVFWAPTDRWNLFALPTLRWQAETGASLSDGQVGGLLAAASYRFNDRLSLGPGFGVFSGLEEDADLFPILAVDWRITDRLSLTTGRGFAATRGPGLALSWAANDRWSLSLTGRYEKERFRLDDRGVAPGGVGQTTATPIYVAVTRKLGNLGSLSAVAGMRLNGSLRLEDSGGDLLERTDVDDAPFAGATFDLRF
ncbi:porin [Thiohalocapsa sp. ML1]|jgi:hypothetical protein|uniref:porin n=1 Tax=Thiohalocapsa sp. ML1 TaxID=1431688 RepID=UPI0020B149EF|nr:porin [Thiohalocapsa sp. ML1]